MIELKCTTNNCEFHYRNRCTASSIEIGEKSVCATKLKRPGGAYAQAVAEFEIAEEFQPADFPVTRIQCECTKCAYNDSECGCTSNFVLVGDSFIKTKCFTKTKKNK